MEEEEEEEEEKEEEELDEGFWDVTPCTAGTDVSKKSTVSIFKIEESSVTILHCFNIWTPLCTKVPAVLIIDYPTNV